MGGRGAFSYSGGYGDIDNDPLHTFAIGSLNKGISKGTNTTDAINRFREQMLSKNHEYSAYIDSNGYLHALGSTGKKGSTKVVDYYKMIKERDIKSVIHNHPHGGDRKWGGPLSVNDYLFANQTRAKSNGKVDTIIATSREGTYTAKITKSVSDVSIKRAANKADATLKKKRYRSEKSMWEAMQKEYSKEMKKIGINVSFSPGTYREKNLITQRLD